MYQCRRPIVRTLHPSTAAQHNAVASLHYTVSHQRTTSWLTPIHSIAVIRRASAHDRMHCDLAARSALSVKAHSHRQFHPLFLFDSHSLVITSLMARLPVEGLTSHILFISIHFTFLSSPLTLQHDFLSCRHWVLNTLYCLLQESRRGQDIQLNRLRRVFARTIRMQTKLNTLGTRTKVTSRI